MRFLPSPCLTEKKVLVFSSLCQLHQDFPTEKRCYVNVFNYFFRINLCREKCNLDYSPCSVGGVVEMEAVSGFFGDLAAFFSFLVSKQTAGKIS